MFSVDRCRNDSNTILVQLVIELIFTCITEDTQKTLRKVISITLIVKHSYKNQHSLLIEYVKHHKRLVYKKYFTHEVSN